ncbi:MAG TPA: prepilin-type N-terminal cleavage/methylation domain-containing protein [Longimicrobiales bacterium]|nr:prepilin-type N-terminal cleavage/methylation domain-containing protein [Longimicrobiales bacterium]
MLRNQQGFTLIELLIVVVIIGILAAIAIPKFGQSREKAYISAMQSDLRQVMTAQEIYYSNPANNYTYAAGTISETETIDGFNATTSQGVEIVITAVDPPNAGWNAIATHTATDQECAVFVNTEPLAPATSEGVITCAAPDEGGAGGGGGAGGDAGGDDSN